MIEYHEYQDRILRNFMCVDYISSRPYVRPIVREYLRYHVLGTAWTMALSYME